MADEKSTEKTTDKKPENIVFVGSKPPKSYVLAVITNFKQGADEVILKARGRAISRAVDVAEISKNRFLEDAEIKEIKIGTETVGEEKKNISTIEIVIKK